MYTNAVEGLYSKTPICEMTSGGDVAFNKEVLQQLIHNDWRIIDTKRSWQCFLCSESHLTATQCADVCMKPGIGVVFLTRFIHLYAFSCTMLACVIKSL